jgi:hypothetical protein
MRIQEGTGQVRQEGRQVRQEVRAVLRKNLHSFGPRRGQHC